jgi:hypothetical protein
MRLASVKRLLNKWGKCSENPANQKKPVAKHTEAYYAHNKRCPGSDAASLSNHRTALASDKSSEGYSSCSDYSNNKDNFAVTISALPCKQPKRKVLPSKKKWAIAMSKSDEGTKDGATSAKLGKLAALHAAAPSVGKKHRLAKDAKRDPLSLSDSN